MDDTHLVGLGDGWGLWRSFCLRAAGFPIDLLDSLADEKLAALADAVVAGADDTDYVARFGAAGVALGHALHRAAADPRIREAVAWQNPAALANGFDTLLRRDPATVTRTGRHRKTEVLVTSYLHRYCAKNDTIGFFGPLRWGTIDPAQASAVEAVHDGTAGSRTLYLEGWAVAALGRALAGPLRPWLVPRLLPLLDVDRPDVDPSVVDRSVVDRSDGPDGPGTGAGGAMLRIPLAAPVPLDRVEAAVLEACRPGRPAREVVAAVTSGPAPVPGPGEVWAAMERLHASRRIEWTLEVPADDLHGIDTMRAVVDRVDDPVVRAPALAALDRLAGAVTAVESARGESAKVLDALATLGETFTALTGEAPAREAGQLYAGRTLVFEECRQPDSIRLGPAALAPLRAPLTLLLASARWYTAAGAALYRRALRGLFDRLSARRPDAPVPFADFWLAARDLLIDDPEPVVRPLTRALQQRWERLLAVPDDARRVQRSATELRAAVTAAFPPGPPGWTAAVQHSPDLMMAASDPRAVAAGDVDWVLGELHPGYHTMRYASWVECHPAPAELARAMATDLPHGAVRLGATGAQGGSATRSSRRLLSAADRRLVFAPDTCDHDPAHDLVVGSCDVVDRSGRLMVRRRADGACHDLIEVVADLVAGNLMPHFRLLPPAAHRPRVSIDRLVVSRETWTFPPDSLGFATDPDEARRFLGVRRWMGTHGLPRHVFVRATGEKKPVHVDLSSLASVEVLARAVRRADRTAGAAARITVTEMLPAPDQLWLTDPAGRRYSAELRFVAAPDPAPSPSARSGRPSTVDDIPD